MMLKFITITFTHFDQSIIVWVDSEICDADIITKCDVEFSNTLHSEYDFKK